MAARVKLSSVDAAVPGAQPFALVDSRQAPASAASPLTVTVELPPFVVAWLNEQARDNLLTAADHACILLCQSVAHIRDKQARRGQRKVPVTPSGTSQNETPAASQQSGLPGVES